MPFAAQLALELGARGLDLEFDYLHATRYRGAQSGGTLHWMHRPATPLRGRRVLLVDDIVDEGHTLSAVRDWCRSEGAADVRIAVLAVKAHDRCVRRIDGRLLGPGRAGSLRLRLRHGLPRTGPQPAGRSTHSNEHRWSEHAPRRPRARRHRRHRRVPARRTRRRRKPPARNALRIPFGRRCASARSAASASPSSRATAKNIGVPPHKINYRANLRRVADGRRARACSRSTPSAASPSASVRRVLACPDQLIDYTWGRISTLSEEPGTDVLHVDFGDPYTPALRAAVIAAAQRAQRRAGRWRLLRRDPGPAPGNAKRRSRACGAMAATWSA